MKASRSNPPQFPFLKGGRWRGTVSSIAGSLFARGESSGAVKRLARDESGLALIIVVTVVAMLTIVVTEFAYTVTIDQFRVRNSLYALQSELIVRSGVNLAEGFLSLDEDPSVDTFVDEWYLTMLQACRQIELPNGALVRCDVKDESGKINVNNTRDRIGQAPATIVTKQAVLRDALRCIFVARDIDLEIIDEYLPAYWQRTGILPDGTERPPPYFRSVEHFAATFNIPTRHLPYLRQRLTAQPPRRLSGVNINTAGPEVLGPLLSEGTCVAPVEVNDILERQLDPENPIRDPDVRGLLGGMENAQVIASTLTTRSSLYRLEASAITNPDPENPNHGGIGKTLSVLIHRECVEETPERCELWTSKPLDWQKEGGARLFRERNRFLGLSEYYGEFDPSRIDELLNQ